MGQCVHHFGNMVFIYTVVINTVVALSFVLFVLYITVNIVICITAVFIFDLVIVVIIDVVIVAIAVIVTIVVMSIMSTLGGGRAGGGALHADRSCHQEESSIL